MRQILILWLMVCFLLHFSGCQTANQPQNPASARSESVQADDDNSSNSSDEIPLVGTKWIIIELHGNGVGKDNNSKEVPFLQLNDDFKASAFAGCNRLFARYELREGMHIRFKNFASTRMACMNMKTEQVLNQVLQTVDTYTIKGKKMTLSIGKAKPLAVFVAQ